MPKSRPPYPEEFRREAVQMVRSGRKVSDVAVSLGVTEQSLRTWVKRDQLERRERDDGLTVAEREELRRLRRENKRLEQERDLLKRAAAFFARETETRRRRPRAYRSPCHASCWRCRARATTSGPLARRPIGSSPTRS
jgi:transposase